VYIQCVCALLSCTEVLVALLALVSPFRAGRQETDWQILSVKDSISIKADALYKASLLQAKLVPGHKYISVIHSQGFRLNKMIYFCLRTYCLLSVTQTSD